MEVTVRMLLAVLAAVAVPGFASADPCEAGGAPVFAIVPGTVKVTLRVGPTFKATLICADRDTLVLIDGAQVRQVPWPEVARIVKPRDSLLNGFAIGAGLGLLLAAGGGEAEYNPDYRAGKAMLQAVGIFGGIGAAIDAMHGPSWTIYTAPWNGPAAPAVTWRKRF